MNPLHPDPEVAAARQLWLDKGLRAPEAKAHVGELESKNDPNARCCLGHACHAHGIRREVECWQDGRVKMVSYQRNSAYLPLELARRLDMTSRGTFVQPVLEEEEHRAGPFQSLVAVNDCMGWSSARMADFIEEQMRAGNLAPFEYDHR